MQELLPPSFREDAALPSSVPAYQSTTGTATLILRHFTVSSGTLPFLSLIASIAALRIWWKLFLGQLRESRFSKGADTCGSSTLEASDKGAACVSVSEKGDPRSSKSAITLRSRNDTSRWRHRHPAWVAATVFFIVMWFNHSYFLALAVYLPGVLSLAEQDVRRQSSSTSTAEPLAVFQVYQPVTFDPASGNACNQEILLMEHQFGSSYGHPFVGEQSVTICHWYDHN